jgi:DMSO/TMAO reductase YedYZ heme-binding membrane subunit
VSQVWWYAARAAGIVSWALLVLSVVWGLMLSSRVRPGRVTPAWMLDLHRFLGGLAVVFIGVHVGALLLDSYVQFSLVDVLVPFVSSWHPLWVAWGIAAVYLALAVEITSLLRRQLPAKVWRRTHTLSLPLLVLATVHFIVAGTDADQPYAFVGIAVAAFVVGGLVGRRLLDVLAPGPAPTRVRVAVPVAPTGEPQRPVASSQPLTVPNRGESRWAPSTAPEEPPSPQPLPR